MDIDTLLTDSYLDKFKIYHEVTLFPPNWNALKEKRCPLCSCKLKFPHNSKVAICSGKKHAKPFIIKLDTLNRLVA